MGKREDDVLTRTRRWYDDVRRDKVRWRTLVHKPLEPEESVRATVTATGFRQVSPDPAKQDLETRPLHKGDAPTVEGLTVATSDRLLLVGNGNRIKLEWSWESIESMTLGAGAQWLTFKEKGVDDHVTAILRMRKSLVSGPAPVEVASHLLTIEGAWYMWKGELDTWMAALPLRFEETPA
jgi:hypothetical protein